MNELIVRMKADKRRIWFITIITFLIIGLFWARLISTAKLSMTDISTSPTLYPNIAAGIIVTIIILIVAAIILILAKRDYPDWGLNKTHVKIMKWIAKGDPDIRKTKVLENFMEDEITKKMTKTYFYLCVIYLIKKKKYVHEDCKKGMYKTCNLKLTPEGKQALVDIEKESFGK